MAKEAKTFVLRGSCFSAQSSSPPIGSRHKPGFPQLGLGTNRGSLSWVSAQTGVPPIGSRHQIWFGSTLSQGKPCSLRSASQKKCVFIRANNVNIEHNSHSGYHPNQTEQLKTRSVAPILEPLSPRAGQVEPRCGLACIRCRQSARALLEEMEVESLLKRNCRPSQRQT